jgi:hypothetical protein
MGQIGGRGGGRRHAGNCAFQYGRICLVRSSSVDSDTDTLP